MSHLRGCRVWRLELAPGPVGVTGRLPVGDRKQPLPPTPFGSSQCRALPASAVRSFQIIPHLKGKCWPFLFLAFFCLCERPHFPNCTPFEGGMLANFIFALFCIVRVTACSFIPHLKGEVLAILLFAFFCLLLATAFSVFTPFEGYMPLKSTPYHTLQHHNAQYQQCNQKPEQNTQHNTRCTKHLQRRTKNRDQPTLKTNSFTDQALCKTIKTDGSKRPKPITRPTASERPTVPRRPKAAPERPTTPDHHPSHQTTRNQNDHATNGSRETKTN